MSRCATCALRGMAGTLRLCEAAGLPQGLRGTSFVADASKEPDVLRFRDDIALRRTLRCRWQCLLMSEPALPPIRCGSRLETMPTRWMLPS